MTSGHRGSAMWVWLWLAAAGALAYAVLFAGRPAAVGHEPEPPVLVFPFPASQTWRITCGYALPEATATEGPPMTSVPGETPDGTQPGTCGHSGEPYNRYALDLQHADGGKAALGQPVLAAAAGTVARAGWHDGLGWHVVLDHGDGYQTVYGHMVRRPLVRAWQEVERGAILGRVGSTGRSTGPHIHFALWKDGVSINPEPICGLRNLQYGQLVTGCAEPPLVRPGDFDGDGSDDLILLNESSAGFARFGRVDFQREWQAPTGPTTWLPRKGEDLQGVEHILSGDFDGDGLSDAALLVVGPYCWGGVDIVGGGQLDLAARRAWWADSEYCVRNVARVTSGDFDGDGMSDIAFLYEVAPGETRIDVLRSDGSRFASPETWWSSAGYFPDRVVGFASGDFDGDGRADLVTLYGYNRCETRAHVFISTSEAFEYSGPDGWWRGEQACARNISQTASADLDGDGRVDDVALLYHLPNGRMRIDALAAKDGSFRQTTLWSEPEEQPRLLQGPRFMSAGDFDGEPDTDLAIIRRGAYCSTIVRVLGGDGLSDDKASLAPQDIVMRNGSCDSRVRDALP